MAYYPDLSKCPGYRKTFNVGWLDEAHPFETARPAKWLVEKLWRYCACPLVLAGGFHECTLADCPGPFRRIKHHYPGGSAPTECELQAQDARLRESLQTGPLARLSAASKAQYLAGLDHSYKRARRGYSKMIIGIHPRSGERALLGADEILVFGKRGQVYHAPNMLYHYVTVHHYQPPREFVQALKEEPCPPDDEYLDRLKLRGYPVAIVQAYRDIQVAKKARKAAQKRQPS